MGLKDKAARIDLSQVGKTTSSPRSAVAKTGIGLHADALFRDEKLAEENKQLQSKLAEFDDAKPARQLKPSMVHSSKWANRHEASFSDADFVNLKREIESAGGNVQPIKVRQMQGSDQFEIVFGHRRHRACLELGINVLAIVEDVSDLQLFAEMDRENRERKDLRPYEVGAMYAKALDEGLFPSAKKLSESIGVDLGQIGKALNLARLPKEVVDAFPSPLDLQYRWAAPLKAALQSDPDLVINRARAFTHAGKNSSAQKVFRHLVGEVTTSASDGHSVELKGKGGRSATIQFDAARSAVHVDFGRISAEEFERLENVLRAFIKG